MLAQSHTGTRDGRMPCTPIMATYGVLDQGGQDILARGYPDRTEVLYHCIVWERRA